MTTEQLPAAVDGTAPRPLSEFPSPAMPFEAKVVREAALACSQARLHNCTIEIHIGGRWGKRPVDVTITPNS